MDEPAMVPEGVTLAPDERVVAAGVFALSNILFFITWKMAITTKRLVGNTPNTVLGIIPLGSTQVSYPMNAIAGVTVAVKYSIFWILVGIVLVFAAVSGRQFNVVVLILGVLAFLAGFRAEIEVANSGGQRAGHAVAFWARGAAVAFAAQVNTALATYAHAPTLVVSAPTSQSAPAAPASATARLKELQELRDAGHLTAEEFETKRREMISQL